MTHVDELPTFTHMKSYMQGLKDGSLLDDKWIRKYSHILAGKKILK